MVVALALAVPCRAAAQLERPVDRETFLAEAATTAERYADRREAMADGFRRIGPEFPGMGVHWVQTSRIVSSDLRGDRPAVLCYAEIDGNATLVGLAYTLPLAPGESPPSEPFGVEVWHDHSGQVTEESLLLNHSSSMTASDDGFRLSMVHVWSPLANPAGVLAQNNWTLPYLRAGLEPPEPPAPGAARGLSLGSGGIAYYRELLHWAAELDTSDRAIIDSLLEERAAEVDAWVALNRDRWGEADLAEVEAVWVALWDDLERSLDADLYERIHPLRAGT
jgi:hypothetical protein